MSFTKLYFILNIIVFVDLLSFSLSVELTPRPIPKINVPKTKTIRNWTHVVAKILFSQDISLKTQQPRQATH